MPRSKQEAKKRKKRRAHFLKDAPFPVPIQSTMTEPLAEGAWFYYTGYIEGSAVVVKHTGDIDFLHKMGFFGKGILSRSEPSFHERKQKVNVRVRKMVKGATEPKPTLIRATVTSKRNYLTHKRYKALFDGNGTEYNYIIHCEDQQKLRLEGLSDGEDCTKDDDDEDEEEEEEDEDDSDDGGPRMSGRSGSKSNMLEAFLMLSGGSVQSMFGARDAGSSVPHRKLSFRDASKETRVSVVALLSELAQMSGEKIATFAKVPQTFPQLKEKYGLLRRAEIVLAQRQQKQVEHLSKEREVIDVDDGEDKGGGDSVVVLDSDEEESSSSEENTTKAQDNGKKLVETAKKASKGWGDYDDGDEDGWDWGDEPAKKGDDVSLSRSGSADTNKTDSVDTCSKDTSDQPSQTKGSPVSKKENVVEEQMEVDCSTKKDAPETNGVNSIKLGEVKTARDEDISKPHKKSSGEEYSPDVPSASNGNSAVNETSSESKISAAEDEKGSSSFSNVISKIDPSKQLLGNHEPSLNPVKDDKVLTSQENQGKGDKSLTETLAEDVDQDCDNVKDQGNKTGDGLSVDLTDENSKDKNDRANLTVTADFDDGASNASDDVICIEAESATPSSVHNLLSQPRSTVVTKAVTFMSNITAEPTYVSAKVGFHSWDSLVHFNYSGDPTHLPTVMSVQSLTTEASSSRGKEESESDRVYERLFPPITTLIPGHKSEGAVIKQRLKGLPCLTPAYFKLSKAGAPTSSSSTLLSSLMSTDMGGNNSSSIKRGAQLSSHLQNQQQQNQTSTSFFYQSTPQSSHNRAEKRKATFGDAVSPIGPDRSTRLPLQSKSSDESSHEHSIISVENSLHLSCTSPQTLQSKSHSSPAIVKMYLKIFDELDPQLHNSTSDTQQSLLSSLSCCVQQLKDLYTQNNSSLPDSPQVTSLLSQFHTDLFKYLSEVSVSPEKESDLLETLVSTFADSAPHLANKETVDITQKLTQFQIRLLKERLDHLQKGIIEDSSDSANSQSKRKKDESTSENPKSKKLKSDFSQSIPRSEDTGKKNGDCKTSGIENESNSFIIHQDSTNMVMESSNSKLSVDEKVEKCKTESETDSESSKVDNENKSCSAEENKNGTHEAIEIEDSTIEDTSKTDMKSKSYVSLSSTHGKSKSAGKRKQGDPKDNSLDPISIGSSSEADEEDDDESDSDSDEWEELPSSSTLDARSLCKADDPEGDLFVINNTSEEEELEDDGEEGQGRAMRNAHCWKPCVKEDPYPVEERLQLMLEEAFFLSYGLGCLRVIDPELKVLDLKQTWAQFQVLKEQFVPHYVAYHYFRSKGWVPKSGLKFGCDFILYREGPPFYHGSYSVVVQCVQEGSLMPCTRREGYPLDHRHLNWISLAGLNRITEHVAKELMFCYVIWPKGLGRKETSSPECIRKFKVKEVLVSRWISSQERENKTEEEDMP